MSGRETERAVSEAPPLEAIAKFIAAIYPAENLCLSIPGTRHQGYVKFSSCGRSWRAHRLAFYIRHNYWPKCIDHLCRNRECVNADHLEDVDVRTNTLRGVGPTAINATKTHCIKGHPLEGKNLRIRPNGGGRMCKKCHGKLSYQSRKRHYENFKDNRKRRTCAECRHHWQPCSPYDKVVTCPKCGVTAYHLLAKLLKGIKL